MYYGRKKWIIIAIIVAILVIALVGVGLFLFLKTDMFKSNSELFYKYIGEQLATYKSSADTQLKQVESLKQSKPYTSEGKLSVSYENVDSPQDPLSEAFENLSLEVDGKYDEANGLENTSFKVINGTQELFTMDSARNGDVYALKSNEIVTNAYVGIRNENLKVLAQKLGVDTVFSQNVPEYMDVESIDPSLFQISDEDIKHIQEMYAPILSNIIKDSNFSKQSGVSISDENGKAYNCNSYRLDLSTEELREVISAVLTQLQQDSITLKLISTNLKVFGLPEENVSIEAISESIQNLLDAFQNVDMEAIATDGISIVVYESEGKAIATEVIVKNAFKVTMFNNVKNSGVELSARVDSLSSEANFSFLSMKISVSETPTQTLADLDINVDNRALIKLTFESNGAASTNSIQNNYSIRVDYENVSVAADYAEDLQFRDSIPDIIELDNTNTAVLNDYTTEQLASFVPAVIQRAIVVFGEKLQSLGVGAVPGNPMTPVQ